MNGQPFHTPQTVNSTSGIHASNNRRSVNYNFTMQALGSKWLGVCFTLLLLNGIIGNLNAQKKTLTLEDAIVQRFRKLYPRGIANLQWVPSTDTVSYLSKDGLYLLKRGYPFHRIDTALGVQNLADGLGMEIKRFPRINWLDQFNFYFRKGGHYYKWNIKSKKGFEWTRIPKGQNADFSRASGHIAYTRKNNLFIQKAEGDTIAVTQNQDHNIVSGQAIARSEFGIVKGIFWSPNGQNLAFYQKDESDVPDYPLVDITTTPAQLQAIKYPMAGSKSEYDKAGVYQISKDTVIFLKTTGAKDHFITNLTWGPKGKYIYLAELNREQNHLQLNQYDASTGERIKTLFEEKHPKYVEPEHGPWFIPGNHQQFLWFSERDGFMHLYRYTTEGKLLGQITYGKWEVLQILGLNRAKTHVYLVGTDTSGLNNHLYKASLDKADVQDLTKEEGMHRYQMADGGRYFIDTYSSLEIPLATQIVDHQARPTYLLKLTKDPMRDYKVGRAEFLDLMAEDSTILHARIIKPSDFDASKKYPVIVYVYGGPHAQMVSNRYLGGAPAWMYYAAEQGYIVFTLDNRGSSRRGLEFENIIHRQLGTTEMKDQLVGVNYLKSLPYVDSTRMAVHGWSFGGFMTTSLMLRAPGTFKVGVAGGPVTDWKYYEVMYGERYMDRPEENPDGYQKARLHNYVNQLQGDLLLIIGSVDPVVVPQHSYTLIKSFVEAGKQMDFFTYPMHEHNVRGKDRVHLMRKVLDYIDEKLNYKPDNKCVLK